MTTPPKTAPRSGEIWLFLEAQHLFSTMKLVDTTHEQALLESLLEDTKPPVPPECRHLHYLLYTPFRYSRYPSRFRTPSSPFGVFYAAENPMTALAEIAFHRLLRLGDTPDLPWPVNPVEFTAFSVRYETARCLDLTRPPHAARPDLTDPIDYTACQTLAAQAHQSGTEVLRSTSVRDPEAGTNISLLTCAAFADTAPSAYQTWRLRFSATGVQAITDDHTLATTLLPEDFHTDPRMTAYPWTRPH